MNSKVELGSIKNNELFISAIGIDRQKNSNDLKNSRQFDYIFINMSFEVFDQKFKDKISYIKEQNENSAFINRV